jgi:hypothetical protein
MTRIVQVGLGPLGIKTATEFLERRQGALLGAVDPRFAGQPLAELVPGADPALKVAAQLDEFVDWSACDAAIVTTRSGLPECLETFRGVLATGTHVVSSCEELAYPTLQHPEASAELDALAKEQGRVLLGTGVNPGFLLDALPVMLSGVCRTVRRVTAGRVQDAASRRVPFQKKIGATLTPAEFEREAAAGTLRHVGLPESLHFVARYLGFELEGWNETLEPVIAERDLTCDLGPIPAGHVAGVRQVAVGNIGGDEVLRLEFQAAIGQANPRDWVLLDADPPVRAVIEGGVHGDHATTAILLNAVEAVREAAPGLRTMAEVRPPRCTRFARA